MPNVKKIVKIKNRTYNSLTKNQKEKFKDIVPKNYQRGHVNGRHQIVETPNCSHAQPFSEEYAEQFKLMDELFKISETAKDLAADVKNNNLYAYRYTNKTIKLRFSDFTVAPILGMDNKTIINLAQKNHTDLSSCVEETMTNGYSRTFSDKLIDKQKSWLLQKIHNTHFHQFFSYYIKEVNNNYGRIECTEEPFFQIIALNEFLQHSEDQNISLGEYSEKNFDKLYDILMSYDYTSYSYTKNLLDKMLNLNNRAIAYEVPLLIHTSRTSKIDREFINSLTKEQIFTIYEKLDNLTSKTASVIHKIEAALEPEKLHDVPSESDLSKMIAKLLAEKIINADYSHTRDMYSLMSSSSSTVKSILSSLAYDKDNVSKNSIYYLRIYDLIKTIEENKDQLSIRQAVGFILSLHPNFKRMAASEGSIGDYINFLEEVLESKKDEQAAQFFGMLGEVLLKADVVPSISQWKNYVHDEKEFFMPISMIINIITDDTNSVQKNPPKELVTIRNSLPI